MFVHRLLIAQLITLLILSVLVFLGIEQYLHEKFFWLDIVQHFLGGVWVGFLALWILPLQGKRRQILFCIIAALVIGGVWEIFEFVTGMTAFPDDTVDTIQDFGMDVLGAVGAVFFTRYIFRLNARKGV